MPRWRHGESISRVTVVGKNREGSREDCFFVIVLIGSGRIAWRCASCVQWWREEGSNAPAERQAQPAPLGRELSRRSEEGTNPEPFLEVSHALLCTCRECYVTSAHRNARTR